MRLMSIVLALAASGAVAQGEKVVAPVSVTPVRVVPERSAAAGGSAATQERPKPMYRVAVRMPGGSVQYRDLDRPEFKVGDSVLLTNAGDIVPD